MSIALVYCSMLLFKMKRAFIKNGKRLIKACPQTFLASLAVHNLSKVKPRAEKGKKETIKVRSPDCFIEIDL